MHLDVAPAAEAWAAAVLLHPHPEMGGDRFNNVVSALFEALPTAGVTACRFDFSSADLAVAGDQVVDALEQLAAAVPEGTPAHVVGYSFGGGVAATVDDERIAGWYLVAPALSMVTATIGADPRPKGIAAAQHDQWFGPDAVRGATASWRNTTVEEIAGADHFFGGRTDAVAAATIAALQAFSRE